MAVRLGLGITRNIEDRSDGPGDQQPYEIEEFDPRIEITETPHSYILIVHLPGIKKKKTYYSSALNENRAFHFFSLLFLMKIGHLIFSFFES